MRPLGVVVPAKAVELADQLLLGLGRVLGGQVLFLRLVETFDLATGLGVIGPECLVAMPRLISSDSMAPIAPPKGVVKMRPLSVKTRCG
jgi:hypothetical protein